MSKRKLTYRGFRQFVRLQPASRSINHSTWCGCAVGDYIKHGEDDVEEWALGNLPYEIFNSLRNIGVAQKYVPTYGSLHQLLNDMRTNQ